MLLLQKLFLYNRKVVEQLFPSDGQTEMTLKTFPCVRYMLCTSSLRVVHERVWLYIVNK